jgi:hypothetical protein
MFQELRKRAPFDDKEHRDELRTKLNAITGISLDPDVIERRAKVPLTALKGEDDLDKFLSSMGWVFTEVMDAGSLSDA